MSSDAQDSLLLGASTAELAQQTLEDQRDETRILSGDLLVASDQRVERYAEDVALLLALSLERLSLVERDVMFVKDCGELEP